MPFSELCQILPSPQPFSHMFTPVGTHFVLWCMVLHTTRYDYVISSFCCSAIEVFTYVDCYMA